MGFPLLIKAVLGGGGKGMKLARAPDELEVAPASQRCMPDYCLPTLERELSQLSLTQHAQAAHTFELLR